MASLAFEKYEGLGNDFVVIDAASEAEVSADLARALCDRRRGIGADGVLVMLPARDPSAAGRMRVLNSDGSVAEMCGNGLRCAALHLARRGSGATRELAIETDAGVRSCVLEGNGAVTADMGIVRVGETRVIVVDGTPVELTEADAGNPHAIALRAVSPAGLAHLGPRLASHPSFPHGANVEFVRLDGGVLDVVVWERGVGPTEACGTGACAAAAVACSRGLVPGNVDVRVRLPGGELDVRYDPRTGRTTMRGPARRVFAGTVPRGS